MHATRMSPALLPGDLSLRRMLGSTSAYDVGAAHICTIVRGTRHVRLCIHPPHQPVI